MGGYKLLRTKLPGCAEECVKFLYVLTVTPVHHH